MSDFEKIPEKPERLTNFQKKYNVASKNFVYVLGKNISLFICMLIPLLLIGFIWTDFAAVIVSPKLWSDGVVTVLMFVVGELMMMRVGADGGKLDAEYIESKKDYTALTSQVGEIGTMLMGVFCDWQIDVELEQAVNFRLRVLRMTPKEWEKVKELPHSELEAKYGKKKAKKLEEIKALEPIELNEAILLYDGETNMRGGVPISGEEYLRNKRHIVEMFVACLFTGLLTVSVALTLTSDITFARVMYTLFKLAMLLFRMARGYDRGARAYNTIEVRQYKAKIYYLRLYTKFIENKTYLKLGEQYGDISQFVAEDIEYVEYTDDEPKEQIGFVKTETTENTTTNEE